MPTIGSPTIVNSNFGIKIIPTYGLHQLGGGQRLQALATPSAPTFSNAPTAGTSFYYFIVAKDINGKITLASPASTGIATAQTPALTWAAVAGAVSYDVLRWTANALPAGSNLTFRGNTTGTTFSDNTATAATTYTTPTRNTTADNSIDGWQGIGTSPTGILHIHTSAGDSIFDANANGFIDKATWQLAVGAPATVGVNKTGIYIVPRAGIIVKAFAACKTAPTGAALIFDIKKGGTTIWSTTANRLSIAAAATSGSQTTFDVTTVAEGDQLTIDIAQIGSTVAGQDITIVLLMLLRNQP